MDPLDFSLRFMGCSTAHRSRGHDAVLRTQRQPRRVCKTAAFALGKNHAHNTPESNGAERFLKALSDDDRVGAEYGEVSSHSS